MIDGAEIQRERERERERAAAERRPLTGEEFLAGIRRAGVQIIDNRKNKAQWEQSAVAD
jgi:hypothetical protein